MTKNIDLQNKTTEELGTMLNDLKAKLLQFNFELGGKRLKDFSQVSKTKKEIARILTTLNKNVPIYPAQGADDKSRILDGKAIGRK